MRFVLLAILLVAAGCAMDAAPQTDGTNETLPPTPQEILERPPIIVVPQENSTIVTPQPNADGYPAPLPRSGAQLLVSDGEKAARLFLYEGQSTNLTTTPPVSVAVLRIGTDGTTQLSLNGEVVTLEEDETAYAVDRAIIVHLTSVIVK